MKKDDAYGRTFWGYMVGLLVGGAIVALIVRAIYKTGLSGDLEDLWIIILTIFGLALLPVVTSITGCYIAIKDHVKAKETIRNLVIIQIVAGCSGIGLLLLPVLPLIARQMALKKPR